MVETTGVSGVMRMLRVSYSRVVQLANAGRLPSVRDHAGRRVFRIADVHRFIAEREARAARPVIAPAESVAAATSSPAAPAA